MFSSHQVCRANQARAAEVEILAVDAVFGCRLMFCDQQTVAEFFSPIWRNKMIRNRAELDVCRREYSDGGFRGPAKMRLLMDSLERAFERIEEAEQSIFNVSDKPRFAFQSYAKLIEVAELQGYCEFPEGFELKEKSCQYIEQNEREAISFLLKEGFEVVYNNEIHFTV